MDSSSDRSPCSSAPFRLPKHEEKVTKNTPNAVQQKPCRRTFLPLSTRIQAVDRSDLLFVAALVLLPVDGTVLGIYAPFWTPISPWLFLAYAVVNYRYVPQTYRRFPTFFRLPLVLVTLSAISWIIFGFHLISAAESMFGILGALACLTSLDIAIRHKQLDWHYLVRIVIMTYWAAFVIGVVQWLAIHMNITAVTEYFSNLMARQYVIADSEWGGDRPQFLFAEPSYIGMHLFGVLLPMLWLMRGRDSIYVARLRELIIVFAIGSIVMGAGTRIILDSFVALVIVIVECVQWSKASTRKRGIFALLGTIVAGFVCFILNNRLTSIAEQGVTGDGSFFARVWQSLGPIMGLIQHPWTLITGYGAGNIADATHAGATSAEDVFLHFGIDPTSPHNWYASVTPETMFTMSAWTSFLTEFGLAGLLLLCAVIIRHIGKQHCWNKTVVCWVMLVAYLYVQFEGYAFYALPLLVWGCDLVRSSKHN